MVQLSEMLSSSALSSIKLTTIQPGSIFIGPMVGVDHDKFYIVAGTAGDRLCVCSVLINSKINNFIQKRPKLLARQVKILKKDYSFLSHDSFINCASPQKGKIDVFQNKSFVFKDVLKPDLLTVVVDNIIASGSLTKEEIDAFFGQKNNSL